MGLPKKRVLRIEAPLDLVRTLGPARIIASSPTMRLAGDEIWRATRTPEGPATLRLCHRGSELVAEAWGAGAEWALASTPELIGEHRKSAGEDRADRLDPPSEPLRSLARRWQGLRTPRTAAVFEALVPTIVAQKVTGKGAARSYRRMVVEWGEPAPGPKEAGLLLPPAPELLASMSYESYHCFDIERRRAETIRRAASRASRLDGAPKMGRSQAYGRIKELPGVGMWTAAKVMYVAWGDQDAVPLGDYNMPAMVAWNLAGEPRANDARMLELLEPFRGYRGWILQLLGAGGKSPPRFGPHLPLRNIRYC